MPKTPFFSAGKSNATLLSGVHRVEMVDERGRVVWDHLADDEAWAYQLSADGKTLRIMKLETRPAGTPLRTD